MSLLPFGVFKACRKRETLASGIGRQEKGGMETNFAHAWQRAFQNALNLSCTIGCMLSEQKGKVVFLCKACALSDSTSSLTNLIAELPDELFFLINGDKSSTIHRTMKAFSLCPIPPPPPTHSRILIHFPESFADSIESWGGSGPVLCHWMRGTCFHKDIPNWQCFLSFRGAARMNDLSDWLWFHKRLISALNATCSLAM